jgi:glycosyltransferase involved in cell wall biosynthesis
MKIIVLGTRGFPDVQGGIEKHCEDLYPRLVAFGCDVLVLAREPYVGPNMYTFKGVTVYPLKCPKHKYLEAFLHTFLGVIRARFMNPDVLHIHAIGPSLFVPLARLLGLKVVVTHHGPDYERKKWNTVSKMILRLGEELGMRYAHYVIAISKVIAQSIRDEFGRVAMIIPNGVNVSPPVEKTEVLSKFNLLSGQYILAVGRFVPEKGFVDLLNAFQKATPMIQNSESPWKLVIVGGADHEDEYSRELKGKSSQMPNVVLTGFQNGPALKELYSHAGHFILPSYHEGLPIVLLEALSFGASCLVSDIPANREVALEDVRYFKPGDIQAISAKLSEFMQHSESLCQRQERVRLIEQKYNWEMIAQNTLNVYAQFETYGGLAVVGCEQNKGLYAGTNTV